MKWKFLLPFCAMTLVLAYSAGCQRSPGQVTDKVLADFGLRDHPDGHVSGSDQVFQRLDQVGQTEMNRMNTANRHGEVRFQEDGLRGMYYKEVKVYEESRPVDARPTPRTAAGGRGFNGYIEYRYRLYQSPRHATRAEAAADTASIPTNETGVELYRYSFGSGAVWNGASGERTRR